MKTKVPVHPGLKGLKNIGAGKERSRWRVLVSRSYGDKRIGRHVSNLIMKDVESQRIRVTRKGFLEGIVIFNSVSIVSIK